jgi:hypothetical protein
MGAVQRLRFELSSYDFEWRISSCSRWSSPRGVEGHVEGQRFGDLVLELGSNIDRGSTRSFRLASERVNGAADHPRVPEFQSISYG